ncbi:hypothetical protein AMECASPLE_033391 [Ameca splendens]|uniref:3-hydroxyacyl-CoA dehydrogenase NAD binding domain-containing protein n=1 Tax=Ameca splendens TaxID=208324 RepID=A0ABV0Z5E7_9TELE
MAFFTHRISRSFSSSAVRSVVIKNVMVIGGGQMGAGIAQVRDTNALNVFREFHGFPTDLPVLSCFVPPGNQSFPLVPAVGCVHVVFKDVLASASTFHLDTAF